MEITVRHARKEDVEHMLQVYNGFTKQFVGSAFRTPRHFRRMLQRKDNISFVALDKQNRIIGYVQARYEKRLNRGEFREIVVDPKQDFEQIAEQLVEKVNALFMEKKVSEITAGSLQSPAYQKLFPKLGFFETESMGVFMFALLDVQKFLNELSPVFANRLKQLENWNGLTQIECKGQSIFIEKTSESVQQVVWTNQPVNLKITLTQELLTKLIFGIADPVESHRTGLLKVEATEGSEKTNQLLKVLFPKKQFLIMDYW